MKPNYYYLKQERGFVGLCTNTLAPGLVHGQLSERTRATVPFLGPLAVSRGGAETMILNTITDPAITALLLFGPEGSSFYPSTNLLQALVNGIDPSGSIVGSVGVAAEYPNLDADLLGEFADRVAIVPLYSSFRPELVDAVEQYLARYGGKLGKSVLDLANRMLKAKRIDYDALNAALEELAKNPPAKKKTSNLDPSKFSRLQPPIFELETTTLEFPSVAMELAKVRDSLHITVAGSSGPHKFIGTDWFDIARMIDACEDIVLTDEQAILLGLELGRLSVSDDTQPVLVDDPNTVTHTEVPRRQPKSDPEYYYHIKKLADSIAIRCLT